MGRPVQSNKAEVRKLGSYSISINFRDKGYGESHQPNFYLLACIGKKMKKFVLILLLMVIACEDNFQVVENNELTFIATEGNFGSSNGAIAVFNGNQQIQNIPDVGDVVQSLAIHNDKLFVLVNNSHLLKVYNITDSGLRLPGINISTDDSGPREMVIVDNYVYFTNWNTQDVKILNLETYFIEGSININGLPESIVSDGSYLWVAISSGSTVEKISLETREIIETIEVGNGPQQMLLEGDLLWISRTYYSANWTETYHGTTLINIQTGEVSMREYGVGTVCGGDMMLIAGEVYRTFEGGVAPLAMDLTLNRSAKIGTYSSNDLYSAGANNNNVFMGITSDFQAPDTVYVHNDLGELSYTYIVGASPGDYEVWSGSN
jgi:hypothetical protein